MTTQEKPRTLPRRANTIRAVAATMAHRKLTEVGARQAISDRIGYLVAALLGAVAFRYFGQNGVVLVAVLYALSAYRAYRAWKRIEAQ